MRTIVGGVLVAVACGCGARLDAGAAEQGEPQPDDRAGEACVDFGLERACGEAELGQQWCDAELGADADAAVSMVWGPCLEEPTCDPGELRACDEGIETCELIEGEPSWGACVVEEPYGESITPLVLVFPDTAIEFEPAGAAAFDVDGTCLSLDWPAAATPWLALDLDRSGSIDAGHELFGSGTRLPDGRRATDGFMALAALDGDGDGRLTAADPRFGELVLWSDHDRDRRSSFAEHESLAARGITAIELGYHREATCDGRGNCAIERAAVEAAAPGVQVVDVHLACQ